MASSGDGQESLADILTPNGHAIGHATADPSVRRMPPGEGGAEAMFARLGAGGADVSRPGARAIRRADGVIVVFTAGTANTPPAIEIEGGAIWVKRLEYPGDDGKRDGGGEA